MPRIRTMAQEERAISARKAWAEYIDEKTVLAERTAKLRAIRLAAQTAKPVPKS
ncbi:hypothetical protein IZ6_05910 [Terrihabitans soli]|uniref:Uncharacterized protein n=1 Tax=Terrihabitans soli TaxID=708113 RepID=A0A6S6QKQ7_9HYPH|nr:hypothetical protein [Terrihabitans soli]BCJ89856.1 hypothetical protein IZ6_05910 [Terrihabitans soli]